ncbi:MAG: c-type cytochrome [bacterium]|nr:c-type cytochrome [bacterium]
MNYPFWDVDIGYGLLMASIAVIHVFVSHFAIGGGLYLVVTEWLAVKRGDSQMLDYLHRLSKFFVLVTVVFGALTGVGIWFIIGLLNPTATEALIRNFIWGWATEWTFFVIEITAALLYLYGWKRMSNRDHQIVGWIYFGAAWMSLFVINGIVTFMLTPGEWLSSGLFWDGFFNPTFWSSLVLRTGVCVMLAGLYSQMVASRYDPSDFKGRMVRFNSGWGLVGLVVVIFSFIWYIAQIPAGITSTASETMKLPMKAVSISHWSAAAIGIMLLIFGFIVPRRMNLLFASLLMLFGLAWFGSYEWYRESIRKPYVIQGYMYGNAIKVAQEEKYREEGYLQQIAYRTGDDGADLFRRACRSCHTIDGYLPLKPAYDGTEVEFIAGTIRGAHVIKGNMPPFMGTEEEIQLLAEYLHAQMDSRSIGEIYSLSGRKLGEKVYDLRCGKCHEFGGFNDKAESLIGLEDADYHDLLDMAGDLAEEMPPFTGDSTERAALIEYLKSIPEGGN